MCRCSCVKIAKPRPLVVNTVVTDNIIRITTKYSWYTAPNDNDCPRFYQDNGEYPCHHTAYEHKHKRSILY